ncbi:MAG: hypothetical protein ACTHNS_09230 [Marmoricola sp.]
MPRLIRTAAAVLATLCLVLLTPMAAHARPVKRAKKPGGTTTTTTTTTPVGARAMWVWTRPTPSTLVSFAQHNGVTDLFLSVPSNLPSSSALTWVRSVAALAAPAGIRLDALGGDVAWLGHPDQAVAWQHAALSTGLFAGSHVDLEPWQDARWGTSSQPQAVRDYLAVLDQLRADTTLPLEADVSFWLWTISTDAGQPLDAAVLARTDGYTIMSYRKAVTGADSITDIGAHELATAAAMGKRSRLGAETNYLGSDATSTKQTFYGTTKTTLATALNTANSTEAAVKGYAGIAVEDYDGWNALAG